MNAMAKPVPPELAGEFFSQVESFQADHLRTVRRTRKAAWWVAAAFGAVAALEAFAIASLAPLHTVEWRLVRVDSTTGVVDDVTTLKEAPKDINDATARYFLAQYVREREGYAFPEAQHNYRAVSIMSTADEQSRYAAEFSGKNPKSPQVVLGKDGFIRAHIISVSILGKGLGQVRFTREEQRQGGVPKVTQWVATLGFDWRPDAPMAASDREVNPIGFQVGDYHIDSVSQ